jgi:DNA-binding MarR family transcriptional regulator
MTEDVDGLANPDGLVSRALWQTQHAVERAFDDALAALGMTTTLAGTLAFLAQEPGQSVADLARRARVSPQSVAKAVARLEQLGMLRKQRHPVHGRIVQLYPTDAGLGVHEAATAVIRRVERDLTAGLDDRARARLLDQLRALRRHAEHLSAHGDVDPPAQGSGTMPG